MLAIENDMKRYADLVALDQVSSALADGEFFGLRGQNGVGKTTRFRQALRRPGRHLAFSARTDFRLARSGAAT